MTPRLPPKFRLPKKFSYPKKPVTMTIPCTASARIDRAFYAMAIANYVPLTGIVPFDWCRAPGGIPEHWRANGNINAAAIDMATFFFGFDNLDEAKAAEARLKAQRIPCQIWDADEERVICRKYFEDLEAQYPDARPTISAIEGNEPEVYWRDHPMFRVS
jgi:hypothetical protein